MLQIFEDDAFSVISLTAAINDRDHVPGRAGAVAFAGVGSGVSTLTVSIESQNQILSLIQTSPRGAPAPKEKSDKRVLRAINIPQIKLEDTIGAHEIQGVRQFGSTSALQGANGVVQDRLSKMAARHDLTLEHHRLGALMGFIKDADGSTLTDLFSVFGVQNSLGANAPEAFDVTPNTEDDFRVKCMAIRRFYERNAKTVLPAGWAPWVFCGDNFFDHLISLPGVKEVYKNTAEQERRLGANYAFGAFEFAGVVYENYRGTDDNATVAINTNEGRAFPSGVPGLFAEYYAPADFWETVNTIGLPRYAKIAPDPRFQQFIELHTQQNPLPLCLRPRLLTKLTFG